MSARWSLRRSCSPRLTQAPDPFFRGLEIEGTLEQYWERMRQRQ